MLWGGAIFNQRPAPFEQSSRPPHHLLERRRTRPRQHSRGDPRVALAADLIDVIGMAAALVQHSQLAFDEVISLCRKPLWRSPRFPAPLELVR